MGYWGAITPQRPPLSNRAALENSPGVKIGALLGCWLAFLVFLPFGVGERLSPFRQPAS